MYQTRTSERNNIDILSQVVQEQQQLVLQSNNDQRLPSYSDLVVHLRLGDGLCGDPDKGFCGRPRNPNTGLVRDCWLYDQDCHTPTPIRRYTYSKSWYDNVATELLETKKNNNDTEVVIVSDASHWTRIEDPRNGNYSTDNQYRQHVADYFEKELNFSSVQLLNSEELDTKPDEDFAYMCGAKTFVAGGGGFSRLVAQVVTARGGRVIYPREKK